MNAGRVGDLLVGNDSGDGRDDVDDAGGMILVDAESAQAVRWHALQVRLGVGFGGFGLFEGTLGDGALLVESLGAFKLDTSQPLVIFGFEIGLVGAGNVVAVNSKQELAFFDYVAEPGFDLDDAPGGEGNHGHGAGDVGLHDAGHVQRGNRLMLDCSDQGKLFGVVNFEIVGVEIGLDGGFGRSFGFGVGLAAVAGDEREAPEAEHNAG